MPIWGCFTPPGPSIFAGDGSYGPQILPTSALWDTWKKLTSIWNFRVKRSIFIQKWSFLCLFGGVFPPQYPQYLPEKAHMGPESYLQVCSEIMKKHFTSMWNLEANRPFLCLQKTTFWQWEGVKPPQGPQFLPGMAHMEPISYLHVFSQVLKKNPTLI